MNFSFIEPLGVLKELQVMFLFSLSECESGPCCLGNVLYVIFLCCVILNPVFTEVCCFYCVYACIIDLLTCEVLLSVLK